MDITLNNYITRTIDIVAKNNCSNKERKKDQNEIKQMISYLETTLLLVKEKYDNYTNKNFTKDIEKKELTLSIKTVQNTSLYANITNRVNLNWFHETDQYSLRINNLVLRGNIGNIYDKKILLNSRIKAHQVTPCVYKNLCKNVLTEQYCKYFHDPLDLLNLKNNKLISYEYYNAARLLTRNFANTSWLYSPKYSESTRCVGSKATLLNDIKILSVSENYKKNIETMKQQVMHDILILLLLNEHNLA